jgi:NAD(P)-dependent dehydrogenase (short-subunit alcohol dehydrogenase family)
MENKTWVLITGASSGIGQYIAIHLSEEYNLILNGRNGATLADVAAQCKNAESHLKWVFDLTDSEDIEESLQAFLANKGIIVSVFIHCAGYLKMLPLKSMSKTYLQDTLSINFTSAALIVKSLISKKVNNAGLQNVVFISSTASIMGAKAFNVYSGSKAALDALMRSLAVELAPKVRLNSVLPGGIQTKMTEHMFNDAELMQRMAKDYPLGLGYPNDIFEMVRFLISEKSRWITGQQFVVDGGRSINISA